MSKISCYACLLLISLFAEVTVINCLENIVKIYFKASFRNKRKMKSFFDGKDKEAAQSSDSKDKYQLSYKSVDMHKENSYKASHSNHNGLNETVPSSDLYVSKQGCEQRSTCLPNKYRKLQLQLSSPKSLLRASNPTFFYGLTRFPDNTIGWALGNPTKNSILPRFPWTKGDSAYYLYQYKVNPQFPWWLNSLRNVRVY